MSRGGELLLYIFARSRRECERVPLFPAAGADEMEDWWTYSPALARRGKKPEPRDMMLSSRT